MPRLRRQELLHQSVLARLTAAFIRTETTLPWPFLLDENRCNDFSSNPPVNSVSGKPVKINGGIGMVELASCSRVKDAKVIAGKKAAGSGDSPSDLFARTVVTGKISAVN